MDFRQDMSDRREELQVGSTVMAELVFSWKALMKTWTVLDTAWNILAMDNKWSVASLTGVILTDIEFQKGDSGSPIFNIDGELIDVVHIK
jgi:S1-C subfamily serine protease